MAITISGVNNNDRIVASDGTIDALSGFNVVGVMTAASFSGDLIGNVTGNVTGNINNTTLLLQTSGTERIRITGNNEIGIAGANYGSAGQVLTSGGSGSAVSWTTISGGVTSDSQENTIGGTGAGDNLDSDTYRNTLFGYQAGEQINSGDDNTLVGWKAADKLTSGYKNCAFGSEALEFLTSGYDNVAMGWEAGRSCNGDGNTMIGNMAGRSMSGSENIAIGDHAYSNGGGTRSIGIGGESVWLGGTDVIGIGKYTMARGGSQIGGIGIGYHAGRNNAGDHNVYIGYQAGYGTGSSPYAIGNYNISLGYRSLYSVTSASSNVAIGASAGDVLTTGGNNIILGDGADASSATVSNEITLGNSSITKFRIPGLGFEVDSSGVDVTGKIGVNVTSPTTNLQLGDGTVNSGNILKLGKRVASNEGNLPLIGHHCHNGTSSGLGLCATSSSGCIHFFTGNDADGFGDGSNEERLRIDANGKVMIGTDTPSSNAAAYMLTVADPNNSLGNCGITIRAATGVSGGTHQGSIFYSNATSGTGEYAGYLQYNHNDNWFRIGVNSDEKVRITSSGNFGINTSTPTDKLDVNGTAIIRSNLYLSNNTYLSSGKGLYFDGGTGSANHLHDYEEGTWTPTAHGYTGSNTSGNCFYTKIGRLVIATFRITWPSLTNSASAEIRGLPFTCINQTVYTFGGAFSETNDNDNLSMIVVANSDKMLILRCGTGGVDAQSISEVSGKDFRGNCIYFTNS